MSSKHDDDPQWVTKAECREQMGGIKEDVRTIKKALVGEDLQGGLVKKVNDLMKERSTTMEILRIAVVPIIVAVISAVVTAWIITGGHL
jgi:hypothetical protein